MASTTMYHPAHPAPPSVHPASTADPTEPAVPESCLATHGNSPKLTFSGTGSYGPDAILFRLTLARMSGN